MEQWIDEKIANLNEKIGKLEECLCKAYDMLERLEDIKRGLRKSPSS